MSWDEDRLHRWIARELAGAASSVLDGPLGDDAACLAPDPRRVVTCVDQTIAGVHFEPTLAPGRAGAKAARRALSDLAASAARPRALLLALRAPRTAREAWMRAAVRGVARAGEAAGAPLVGGDLACAPGPASLTVSAIGAREPGRRAPSRDRARPGHAVVVTGALGGSGLGRHLRVLPRVEEGLWLARHGACAMMDVSDGLAWDLYRLARASGVRIDLGEVPIHADARRAARASGRDPLWHALHDGEDHELVATVPAARLAALERAATLRVPGLAVIGRVRAGSGLWIARDGTRARWRPGEGGWRHGR